MNGQIDFSGGCVVMGILNVTPDSFSDGGQFDDTDAAVNRGVEMATAGAGVIDVGGESTRPGAERVSVEQQIERAVPVIEKLSKQIEVPISIDTRDYEVAKAAVDAGAGMINDITAGQDERMIKLAANEKLPICLMHMQGQPGTMQKNPKYDDVVGEVLDFLKERAAKCERCGVAKDMIFIDPGIGFGKTFEHNIMLLRNLDVFVGSGYKVLLGTSRKKFLGDITGKTIPAERIFATAATVALAACQGVSVVRVHDVTEMVDVVKVANAINRQI